ncbi:hypothetical protein QTL86_13490 [Cellulosilyticum sp. ST5]|uniref:hypothetical protein n=1 Tax=Cellulosilyticum sp. ST5 TaxID=3055805 RepID=UPI0039773751
MALKWVSKPKKKKKIEYSKRIVAIVLSFCIVVTLFSMGAMIYIRDLSALSTLIMSVFGETGAVIAFYLKKAEKENIAKGAKKNESELETEVNI